LVFISDESNHWFVYICFDTNFESFWFDFCQKMSESLVKIEIPDILDELIGKLNENSKKNQKLEKMNWKTKSKDWNLIWNSPKNV